MRLIDADNLIEAMKKIETEYENEMACPSWWSALVAISEQPTAYDIDKVVEELKELRKKDVCDYLDCDVCLYTDKCSAETDQSNNIKWDKAIEIVKQGGVSDDVCEWIKYDYRTICPKNHDANNPYWRIPDNMDKLKYCPYCGKKIKVIGGGVND